MVGWGGGVFRCCFSCLVLLLWVMLLVVLLVKCCCAVVFERNKSLLDFSFSWLRLFLTHRHQCWRKLSSAQSLFLPTHKQNVAPTVNVNRRTPLRNPEIKNAKGVAKNMPVNAEKLKKMAKEIARYPF